jgi:hypothetical protein
MQEDAGSAANAIRRSGSTAEVFAVFLLLFMWKTPPRLAVAFGAVGGAVLAPIPFGS